MTGFWANMFGDSDDAIETERAGVPTGFVAVTFGVCPCGDESELSNGLCLDCWEDMVDAMPHYIMVDPSAEYWDDYFGDDLAPAMA